MNGRQCGIGGDPRPRPDPATHELCDLEHVTYPLGKGGLPWKSMETQGQLQGPALTHMALPEACLHISFVLMYFILKEGPPNYIILSPTNPILPLLLGLQFLLCTVKENVGFT